MVWYFIGVYIINRTLHGRLEIRNFSSRDETIFHSFAALTREIVFNTRRGISYLRYHVTSSICFLLLTPLRINTNRKIKVILRENDSHKIDKLVWLSPKQILPGSKGVSVWRIWIVYLLLSKDNVTEESYLALYEGPRSLETTPW